MLGEIFSETFKSSSFYNFNFPLSLPFTITLSSLILYPLFHIISALRLCYLYHLLSKYYLFSVCSLKMEPLQRTSSSEIRCIRKDHLPQHRDDFWSCDLPPEPSSRKFNTFQFNLSLFSSVWRICGFCEASQACNLKKTRLVSWSDSRFFEAFQLLTSKRFQFFFNFLSPHPVSVDFKRNSLVRSISFSHR